MLIQEVIQNKNPKAVFIFGPPAHGKTSVADQVFEKERGFVVLDVDRPADEYRKKYGISNTVKIGEPPSKQSKFKQKPMGEYGDPEEYLKARPKKKLKPHHAMIAANEVVKRTAAKAVEAGVDIVYVETGARPGMKKRIQELEQHGYDVYCIFIAIRPNIDLNNEHDFDIMVQDTLHRQQQRERQLDPAVIKRALKKSQDTKEKILPLFNNLEYIDTGVLDAKQAQEAARKILLNWNI